jgi:hyperosmotically inducible periplasmic protein
MTGACLEGEKYMNGKFKAMLGAAAISTLLLGSGCNVFRGESTPGQYVDDVAITTKIKADMVDSKRVDAIDVNVDSANGRVKLSGFANTAAEIQAAGEIARSVKGVKSVDNQLKIKT